MVQMTKESSTYALMTANAPDSIVKKAGEAIKKANQWEKDKWTSEHGLRLKKIWENTSPTKKAKLCKTGSKNMTEWWTDEHKAQKSKD